jgi:glutathione S-transferase
MEVVSPLIGQEARGLEGLHLYHYALSNCSQKVRMVLAEKGIVWTSHHLDLARAEHTAAAYRGINPNGTVPALVHDGTIVIESSDVMEYLDEQFPDPPLQPARERDLCQMRHWVARQDSIQQALVVLSREFFFPALGIVQPRESRSTVAGAIRVVDEALAELNRHLVDRMWIAGEALSLADVAWVVDVHRLALLYFPMTTYPALRAWYKRMRRLTSFRQAVLSYEPAGLRRQLAAHAFRRWCLRSHAGAPKWRSAKLLSN